MLKYLSRFRGPGAATTMRLRGHAGMQIGDATPISGVLIQPLSAEGHDNEYSTDKQRKTYGLG